MEDFLTFDNVCFRYLEEADSDILSHTCLSIAEGKTTVLVGSSGCGKSTLALLAAGVYPENGGKLVSGDIRIMGQPCAGLTVAERTRLLTVLFQNPDLQFCMDSLRAEMIFCLENLSVEPGRMDRQIDEFAWEYGVCGLLDRKFHTLSGGEKPPLGARMATL